MNFKWWVVLVLASVIPAFASQQASAVPVTAISLHSEPGDFVGQGFEYLFNTTNGIFDIALVDDFDMNGVADRVSIRFIGTQPGTFVNAFIQSPFDESLTPGFYGTAERMAGIGHAGLDIGVNGRGCNTSNGSFSILNDISFQGSSLLSFGATFEQHCEGAQPALFGTILYNFEIVAVPAPASVALLSFGLLGLMAVRGRAWAATSRGAQRVRATVASWVIPG